jgi:hypothetical protein
MEQEEQPFIKADLRVFGAIGLQDAWLQKHTFIALYEHRRNTNRNRLTSSL